MKSATEKPQKIEHKTPSSKYMMGYFIALASEWPVEMIYFQGIG